MDPSLTRPTVASISIAMRDSAVESFETIKMPENCQILILTGTKRLTDVRINLRFL